MQDASTGLCLLGTLCDERCGLACSRRTTAAWARELGTRGRRNTWRGIRRGTTANKGGEQQDEGGRDKGGQYKYIYSTSNLSTLGSTRKTHCNAEGNSAQMVACCPLILPTLRDNFAL